MHHPALLKIVFQLDIEPKKYQKKFEAAHIWAFWDNQFLLMRYINKDATKVDINYMDLNDTN